MRHIRRVWRSAACLRAASLPVVVILLLDLTVIVAPRVAQAQVTGTIPRVGVIGEFPLTHPFIGAFREGLRELGYTEGQSVVVEYRNAQGALDRVPTLAAELIRLKVDILVVGGTVSTKLAKAQTTTVPIVFATASDPVGTGLVASLARPGGNATGMSILGPELSGKQLELLKTVAPRISRVAVLYNPLSSAGGLALNVAREAARALAVELQVVEMRSNEVPSAFSSMTGRAGALLVLSDPLVGSELPQIAELSAQKRLPAIYLRREFAEVGGLLAYGPSFSDNYRRAATYVDKILGGAKPAELPVQQATKFDLVINRRTANTLGLTIPQSLLLQADQIID